MTTIDALRCARCARPYGACTCWGPITITAETIVVDDIPALDRAAPPLPGILSDLPIIKERAERVKERALHKDLDGPTARQLALDILALCQALEEAY